jgi:hypothetical protein
MKNRVNLEESLSIPWRGGTQLGFEDHEGRGVESPRNRRDSVESPQNHLGRAWRCKELKWRANERLGFEGV